MDKIDDLVQRHARLTSEHKKTSSDLSHLKSELNARKGELKRLMDETREAGFDPNNLASDLARLSEVVAVKLNNFESELRDVNKIIEPMMKELDNA